VPFLLASRKELTDVCAPSDEIRKYGPRTEVDGASPELISQMAKAQRELLEEAARNGTLTPPSGMAKLARPPMPSGMGDEAVEQGVRWQWAALQTLMYGGESYPHLVVALPTWFKNRELAAAAVVVQQQYRNRLARRLARVRREALERKKTLDAVAKAKAHIRAAAVLQGQWRGFIVRRAVKEVPDADRTSPSLVPS
jgi:hypothetical protein